MAIRRVNLRKYGISSIMREIREAYSGPHQRIHDYQRWSYVLDRVSGGALLDVGIGVGQFVNGAAATNRFDRIVGVDFRPHTQLLTLDDSIEFVWTDAADLPFEDDTFDVATCMECLEHLDDETLTPALAELRRVTRGDLVMTVPWEEPEPLPTFHKQRFDRHRIWSMFPDSEITLLEKDGAGCPWALIVETDPT